MSQATRLEALGTPKAEVGIALGPLVKAVLARCMSTVAAGCDFTVDRLGEVVLVADAIAAHAPDYIDGDKLTAFIHVDDQVMTVRVGPLAGGGGKQTLADANLPGAGDVIGRLASAVEVAVGTDDSEWLVLKIAQQVEQG